MCLYSRDMLKIILSELNHNLIWMKWGWTAWMFLYFMISGTHPLITVHQPPVLTAALGEDLIMPCHLNLSNEEKMTARPVLYWVHTDNEKLWVPSERYKRRVDLLDSDPLSLNKSIRLKNVQLADNGKYLCKVSVTMAGGKSFRMKGNGTLVMVYGNMTFGLTSHNDSLLQCEVNVTQGPGLVLSIFHNECKPQTVDSASGDTDAALPYVTLSETIPLRGGGKYECQLHLNENLIVESIFNYTPPVAGKDEKNILTAHPTTSPEPWFLYVALLLVPTTILLGLVTVLLINRP
ncbi:uncharacterized protein LOC108899596 isoform X2 [Lates calcarifer]|uniref:Uncharacterized protein LOC108899596 isoform X2 n=1 Tax=Lates calcarifer TaxID=8187 RepID=A0AAJ7VII9_LATCA|nr:uncharacterized protein LOC108899596 isoform X2 [Lates calcarifer]